MLLILWIGLTLYCFLIVSCMSELLAVSLSGVLAVLTSLFILVTGFRLSLRQTLIYGQLTLLVELNQPLLKEVHRPDFPGYWAAARAFDTFFVLFGLFLVLTILLEDSRPPEFNW